MKISILEIDKYGNKSWFLNDERHREDPGLDGLILPAIVWADGTKFWFLNGVRVSK